MTNTLYDTQNIKCSRRLHEHERKYKQLQLVCIGHVGSVAGCRVSNAYQSFLFVVSFACYTMLTPVDPLI